MGDKFLLRIIAILNIYNVFHLIKLWIFFFKKRLFSIIFLKKSFFFFFFSVNQIFPLENGNNSNFYINKKLLFFLEIILTTVSYLEIFSTHKIIFKKK